MVALTSTEGDEEESGNCSPVMLSSSRPHFPWCLALVSDAKNQTDLRAAVRRQEPGCEAAVVAVAAGRG